MGSIPNQWPRRFHKQRDLLLSNNQLEIAGYRCYKTPGVGTIGVGLIVVGWILVGLTSVGLIDFGLILLGVIVVGFTTVGLMGVADIPATR